MYDRKQYAKQYYLDHPELKERMKLYARKKREKATPEEKIKNREYEKRYKEINKDKFKQYAKKWNDSEGRKQSVKKWGKSEKLKLWKEERQIFISNIKIKYGCMNPNCNSSKNIDSCCLDVHHINSKNKSFNLAASANYSFKKIYLELNKCTVLCAICHRLVTYSKLDVSNFKTCNIDELGNIL